MPETVAHYVLECPRFYTQRTILRDRLRGLGVDLSLRTVLGSIHTVMEDGTRAQVVRVFCQFLNNTGRLVRSCNY